MFEEQVGEWITVRRDELGLTVRDFSHALGVDAKTVNNVEAGRTAVRLGTRARWEDVLNWERGSLTAAYKRGEHPKIAAPTEQDELARLVARVPPEFRDIARRQLEVLIDQDRGTMGDRKIG